MYLCIVDPDLNPVMAVWLHDSRINRAGVHTVEGTCMLVDSGVCH